MTPLSSKTCLSLKIWLAGFISIMPSYSSGADMLEATLDPMLSDMQESIPGKVHLNIRTRYETFETDAIDLDGLSQRLRYGYTTESFHGFSAMAEGETLYAISDSADIPPLDNAGDGTDLNQLWIKYDHSEYGEAKLGRQVFTLDDHRFIGDVGWRQNMQSFDGLTAHFKSIPHWTWTPFYLDQAERINLDSAEMDTYGINAKYQGLDELTPTLFYYSIGIDANQGLGQNASNDTYGARLTGNHEYETIRIEWAGSYAHQQDNDSNTAGTDYSLNYYAFDASASYVGFQLGGGFEIMEGDGTQGFRTPLATVHKFNGFADKFAGRSLGGIPNGLEDYYLYAGYKIPVGNGLKTKIVYHQFDPENADGQYGDEVDFVASYTINSYLNTVLKYGDYDPDSNATGVGIGRKEIFSWEINFQF